MSGQPGVSDATRAVVVWLLVVYGLILVMVMIGGITRLTGSGLSMVEWRPLMGTLPPLNEAEWLEVFDKYKLTPQYLHVNDWMTLVDFKRIFFWEYLHRVFGRLIGAAFFVPWVYFLVRKRMTPRFAKKTLVAFGFGILQGILGWYMVASGLVEMPEVSHYRLAAHLSLAFLVAVYLLWLALDAIPQRPRLVAVADRVKAAPKWLWGFVALLSVQIVWGAFMAGKRAGWVASSFPDMNGELVPSSMQGIFEDPVGIHFFHRLLGWLVLIAGAALWVYTAKRARTHRQRFSSHAIGALTVAQFLLGVLTVVLSVPIPVAVAHQAVALLLLSAAVGHAHGLRYEPPTVPATHVDGSS